MSRSRNDQYAKCPVTSHTMIQVQLHSFLNFSTIVG